MISRVMMLAALGLLWAVAGGAGRAGAATVKLEDGTTLTADVLRVDDDGIALRLERGSVRTIDGQALAPPLREGTAAPVFSVKDVAGQPQRVGPSGPALTVLHFWVSWCPFCQADAPVMQQLHARYREDARVRIVTVSLDEKREALDAFVKERQVTYPVISAREQVPAAGVDLPQLYQITGFPVTLLIDGRGIIRRKIGGSFVKGNVDLAAAIDSFL
jgi:thiol-disulfide isomerase/thioredoxin